MSQIWSGLWAVAGGLFVLMVLQAISSSPMGGLPSLTALLIVSFATGVMYVLIRHLSYWTARIIVTHMYPPVGRVHPAASGELPRTAFLCVLLVPGIMSVCVGAISVLLGVAFTPKFHLAAAVLIGIALRDLRAARVVLFVPASRWIREKRDGLEVLQLLDAT